MSWARRNPRGKGKAMRRTGRAGPEASPCLGRLLVGLGVVANSTGALAGRLGCALLARVAGWAGQVRQAWPAGGHGATSVVRSPYFEPSPSKHLS